MIDIYTDGIQTVAVKSKYAYHYNKAGSVIGRSQFENKRDFIDQLHRTGFVRLEEN